MTNPTKPLDIEAEARELLARHALETGADQYKGLVTVPLALSAITEALTERDRYKAALEIAMASLRRIVCRPAHELHYDAADAANALDAIEKLPLTELNEEAIRLGLE